eukprot:scaffold8357_cov114-Isochrysis_galbana.AAC.3
MRSVIFDEGAVVERGGPEDSSALFGLHCEAAVKLGASALLHVCERGGEAGQRARRRSTRASGVTVRGRARVLGGGDIWPAGA